MKRTLLLLSLFYFVGIARAQITVTNASFPMAGDTLFTAIDNLPSNIDVQAPGGDVTWDFTTLQSPFTRSNVVKAASEGDAFNQFPEADLIVSMGENSEGYVNVTDEVIELVGFNGEDPLGQGIQVTARFDPPLVQKRAPMNFFDVNQSESALVFPISADEIPSQLLNQLPITPDSLRIRYTFDRLDVVDAWGTLTIPGGIYDVLREKRTEVSELRLDAKLGFTDWIDITDIALQVAGLEQLGMDTTISYNYFSETSKEPIAVVNFNASETLIETVIYKSSDISTNVQNVEKMSPGVYAFPNPAIVNVRFEFTNLTPGEYSLKIYNILGIEVWNKDYDITDGYLTEKENISSLKKGTYLYSLVDERGKTISTKRLIVVRP